MLNLGGIANLTFLHADGRISGHDCGPGNVLLDAWCAQHTGAPYDDGGRWAAQGQVSSHLLLQLMREPYLSRQPPKSSGRDLFNANWLQTQLRTLHSAGHQITDRDVQATLARFTVSAAVQDLRIGMPHLQKLLVCGGGALNSFLLAELQRTLPDATVMPIQHASAMHPMEVEAAAFAWLAWAFVERRPGNCTEVTGAKGTRILGSLYPG